jgi:two-component system nitrogen regulation response regulator GlnG
MPADLQTRLLRVLSTGEFYRVGGVAPIRVDVRVVAATHQDLDDLVREGRFREDLYHRLNVIRVRIPPLRERPEDIPQLARSFLLRAAEELKTEPKRVRADVMQRLKNFHWPGNVRQLENICRWLTVMAPGQDVHPEDLPPELTPEAPSAAGPTAPTTVVPGTSMPSGSTAVPASTPIAGNWNDRLGEWARRELAAGHSDLLGTAMPLFERTMIDVALAATKGQRQEAARRLGWGRNTLTRKIKELGITDDD